MAALSNDPDSITAAQRRALFALAKKRGLSLDDLRGAAGGHVSALSRSRASDLIKLIGGGCLPNLPGQKPRPKRNKSRPGVFRMITVDQIAQIVRLMDAYFERHSDGLAWLKKYRHVDTIRELGSARKGGHVIGVLKTMIQRKVDGHGRPRRIAAN